VSAVPALGPPRTVGKRHALLYSGRQGTVVRVDIARKDKGTGRVEDPKLMVPGRPEESLLRVVN